MRKPTFGVVTIAIAILVALGFVSRGLVNSIPLPVENALSGETSEFMRRAAIQQIDWKPPSDEAFASARRRALPILLFIGNAFDPLARGLDLGVLRSPRVQEFLTRNFECIRVDLLDHPEFRNAFLPITKSRIGTAPGFQILVLNASGGIVDYIPTLVGLFPDDENLFIGELVQARDRFEATPKMADVDYNNAQEKDVALLTRLGAPSPPPFVQFNQLLATAISSHGGFFDPDFRYMQPEPWHYLLATGRISDFESSTLAVMRSPIVDLLDGGFFIGTRDTKWTSVEHAKSAVSNAAIASLLAAAATESSSPIYRYLAERTIDGFLEEFVQPTGIAAYRPSDQGENQRSLRSSFGVRKLRSLTAGTPSYKFAQDHLGLKVETNPRMTPRLADDVFASERAQLDKVLKELSSGSSPAPPTDGIGISDVTGYCVARIIEASRTLGSEPRVEQATALFKWVESLKIEGGHSGTREPFVGDYLGYADAALQHYLATGKYQSILAGRDVMLRALEEFKGPASGILNLGKQRASPQLWNASLPEVYDGYDESITAQAIRLAMDYGRIFPQDLSLIQFANAAAGNYGGVCFALGPYGAGYMRAALSVFDDEFFVCVGSRAQEWADELRIRQPFRLSIPAFGDIRADVQAKGPGVYLIRGARVQGPLDLQTAISSVPRHLGPAR